MLLIVPGLYLLTIWAVAAPAIVVERRGAIEAFGRSHELVKGEGWTVFGAIVVAFLILVGFAIVAAAIGAAIGSVAGVIILVIIANTLAAPFAALVSSVLFFELRGPTPADGYPGRTRPPRPPERSERRAVQALGLRSREQPVDHHTVNLISIPLFTGAIGYLTNWTGVLMLFQPVRFAGVRVPGLSALAQVLPRRIQQIPGIANGGIGWQGIIPSRAAKMGSIAVDKGIAKLGSPSEFYKQLNPEKIAEHILVTAREDIRALVDRILVREHPQLWRDLPPQLRERVHERVQAELPKIVREMTDDIGENIEHLMDIKLMVIRRIEERPELANRIFLEVGRKELRFIINFGFFFGAALGFPMVFITEAFPYWWVLPLGGVVIGYVTNWVALWMIFEPVEERRIGPLKIHGLFLRRQPEVADVYAGIIADDIVTLSNMGDELLNGPQSDRTRWMIEDRLRPAVDRSLGRVRPAVRVAMGTQQYDAIRESLASEAVEYTMTPLTDPDFNAEQSASVRKLIAARMLELPSADFQELLRSAMREDEWLLLLHGAVLGFAAGLLHLAIFGPG